MNARQMELPGPGQPVGAGAFAAPALSVAEGLMGCVLCREVDGKTLRWPITETEAYDGPEDKASHARSGRTGRTSVMFGPAGICYVYLCYGVHWLLNIVTGPEGYPGAVLIRGAGEVNGPGRLTKALSVTGELNRKAATPDSGLWIENSRNASAPAFLRTPRIGVAYAGPDWGNRPYRFIRKDRLHAAARARMVPPCQSP